MQADGAAEGVFADGAERAGAEPELQFPGGRGASGGAEPAAQADDHWVADQGGEAADTDRARDARPRND